MNFILRVLFLYLVIRFIIWISSFLVHFFVSQNQVGSRKQNKRRTESQRPKGKKVVDAEFREIE